MKKVLAIILCATIALTLCACGSTSSSGSTASKASSASSAASSSKASSASSAAASSSKASSSAASSAASSSGKTYKVGVPTMLTGSGAEKGISGLNSVKIAVQEINDAGGINGTPLEIVVEDTASDTSQAIEIAKKFIANKDIVGIIGCDNTADSMATISYYDEAKMPFISIMASSNTFAPTSHYGFTVSGMVKNEVQCTANMIGDYLKAKSMVMIYVNNDWGTSFTTNIKEECAKYNVNVLGIESYVDGEKDFSSLVTKVHQLNPEVIFMGSQYAEAGAIVNTIKAMGWDVKLTGTGAITNDNFLKLAGNNANGVYSYAATVWTDDYPVAAAFAKKYTAAYGTNPNVFCCGWEATWAMADALKTLSGTFTRDQLTEAIWKLPKLKGLNGDMVWDDVGNTVKNYGFMKVVDGKWAVDGLYDAQKAAK